MIFCIGSDFVKKEILDEPIPLHGQSSGSLELFLKTKRAKASL